jgi:hypothetical protein
MLHRFYDIVGERDDLTEFAVEKDYILDVPEHDMSTPIERQEYLANMFDIIVAASGHNVSSFRTEAVS